MKEESGPFYGRELSTRPYSTQRIVVNIIGIIRLRESRESLLTTIRPRRAEILVSFSPLNKYSFLYLPQDGSVLKLSTHCRVFRVPHGTIQNQKYWFLGVLVARSFYPHKLLGAQPHNFSFQGALPSGDWVFNVVEYPSHITILSRPKIKSRPKRTRL